jgi:GrpB-like predicted nucleotidyltransferase (UPF0157 family)
MTGQPVHIADYDPRWAATFRQIRDQITAAPGPLARRVEHVGSTAVPGLAAKPIIDIDIVIAGGAVCAALVFAAGLAVITVRGARDRADG